MKKNKNKKEEVFSSSEVMTMLENMNDGIQIISEQHGEIVKKLDGINEKISKIEFRINKIESRLNKIEGDINAIKKEIIEIRQDLKEEVSYEEFEKLEKRVIKLEKLAMAR